MLSMSSHFLPHPPKSNDTTVIGRTVDTGLNGSLELASYPNYVVSNIYGCGDYSGFYGPTCTCTYVHVWDTFLCCITSLYSI